MGKRKGTPHSTASTPTRDQTGNPKSPPAPPSPTLSATSTGTEGDDTDFMDADGGAGTAAPSEAGDDGDLNDDVQVEVEPPATTGSTDTNDPRPADPADGTQDDDKGSPSTPTRSRSPVEPSRVPSDDLSKRLSTASLASGAGRGPSTPPPGSSAMAASSSSHSQSESADVLSPLAPISTAPSTYEKPKRPFSLSSEPDTPTFPATPSSPSPRKHLARAPVSPGPATNASPSLTTQVWRNSMGLPPSPVPALSFANHSNARTSRTFADIDLDEGGNPSRDGSPARAASAARVSTRLEYPHPPSPPTSASNDEAHASGSDAIVAEFARVREQSENAGQSAAEGGDGEAVDWDFWGKVMSDYEEVARTQPKELSRAIQRGIPPALRGMTWQLMAAAKDPTLETVYQDLLAQTSPHEKSIARDLSRTFPKHEYFMDEAGVGQENLDGSHRHLAARCLSAFVQMPDEETFCVLVRLMKSYDLRSHYTPNMPGLQLRLFQFDRLVEELLPGVFLHMLRQGVKSSMYASQWFLTLFGYRFPLELVSAVFDLVFAEGVEAIFRFAIALIKRNEDVLLKLEFEDLIEFLKNGLFEVYAPTDDDLMKNRNATYRVRDFVREALQVRITPLMLDQFGEEWSTLLAAQTAHTAELDALRKANLQLSLQVRHLEASLSQINLEHCELVKQVVKARLEREELEDELVKYKIAFANAEFKAASDRASMSPLSLRRQSELSIASQSSLNNGRGDSSGMSSRSDSIGY
ncbi:hypothetical protein JCM10212_006718 [Sporobolomyces blumeae]